MPAPMSEIHRDRPMEQISLKYVNSRLIASALVPTVPVKRESDQYYIFTKDHLKLRDTLRANRAVANRMEWHASVSSYLVNEHALVDYVSDRDKDNADVPIQVDVDTTEALTESILVRMEYDVAGLMTTTNWSNSLSVTSTAKWSSNTDTTNPIIMIDSATSVIAASAAKLPNTLVLNDPVYRAAKEHKSVVDRVKYTSMDSITPEILARLFQVDRVLVAGGIVNSGGDGLADSMGFIWPNVAFLSYMEPNPGLRKVSAMYRFAKVEAGNPWVVKRWREYDRDSDAIQVSTMYQFKPVATDCAYLYTGLV